MTRFANKEAYDAFVAKNGVQAAAGGRGPGGPKEKAPPSLANGGGPRDSAVSPRDARMSKRIQEKFGKMSSRFPGYKPELASPVDTRDELKSYRTGLRDYRKTNPGIKPVRGPGPTPASPGGMSAQQSMRPMGQMTGTPGSAPLTQQTANMAAMQPPNPTMKGGGLARKGVGQALAKGGLVKANGCAARGKTKGRMV
jgi:hypothetical protein